ncbi:sterol desaturase family protein [Mesorhizobium amorphae]|nr:sterol desaturase family protein [Mesorhizobium amorphae]ANT54240.1 desaturase [Mesorhizobium amorphae CCNWGS0123]
MVHETERVDTGGWAPPELIEIPPVFVWPPRPIDVFKFVFGWNGYLYPYTVLYAGLGFLAWWYLIPDFAEMKNLRFDWIAKLFLENLAIIIVWTSFWHLRLYVQRAQDTEYKFNKRWPKNSDLFLFGNQFYDNAFLTLVSAVPIWTAYLVLTLWAMANGWIPYVDAREHPIYVALFVLLLPLFREVHFYAIHRLVHWPVLYRWIHSVHHKNSNPTPWSGLAMHPAEHVLLFSSILLNWIIPSNPFMVVMHLLRISLNSVVDHTGFGKVVFVDGKAQIDGASYSHYLHHRFFEVNYSDGVVPIDRLFGTFHDGSQKAHNTMNERFKKKNAKEPSAPTP